MYKIGLKHYLFWTLENHRYVDNCISYVTSMKLFLTPMYSYLIPFECIIFVIACFRK